MKTKLVFTSNGIFTIKLLEGYEIDIWKSNHHPVKQPKNRKIILTEEDMNVNFLIKFLSKYTKPIDGDPNVWLERPYKRLGTEWREFLCGSCRGIYRCENNEFQILAVQNTKKNDNFDRVLDWFFKSCKRLNYKLSFLEVGNPKLKEKLERLGFEGTEQKMTLIII